MGGAIAARREKTKGSIEVRKLADAIIISQDLFKIAPKQIGKTKVMMTMVGGKVVCPDPSWGGEKAFGFFDHDNLNWTRQIAEPFKIEKGNICRIEAIFYRCPYGMNAGWSTYEQGMSDQIQSIR